MTPEQFLVDAGKAKQMALKAEKYLADLKTVLNWEFPTGQFRGKRLSNYLCIEEETATELKISLFGLELRFRMEIQLSNEGPIVSIGAYSVSYDNEQQETGLGSKYSVDELGNIFRFDGNQWSVLSGGHNEFPSSFLTDVLSAIVAQRLLLRPQKSLAT